MLELSTNVIDEIVEISTYNDTYHKNILEEKIIYIFENSKYTSAFVSFLNGQLSNGETRERGFILLTAFVPVCVRLRHHTVLTDHAITWFSYLLKYCPHELYLRDQVYMLISKLLHVCHQNPDLNKSLTTSGLLSKLIEQICKSSSRCEGASADLECLNLCLELYSGACVPYRGTIEKHLMSHVDCSLTSFNTCTKLAGKCLITLQQVGGGGTHGIHHKEAWKTYFENLCATVHSLMDLLFESLPEFHKFSNTSITLLQLPQINQPNEFLSNTNRFINLLGFLQQMLLGKFPVAKPIKPRLIIDIIRRGLAVTRTVIEKHVFHSSDLSSQLCIIHKHLLLLLQAFIICLGRNSIPYASVICKLLLNSFENNSPTVIVQHNICELRVTLYDTLRVWLTITKSTSRAHFIADKLIATILKDIQPVQNEIHLTIEKSNSKQLSKKAKRKIQIEHMTRNAISSSNGQFQENFLFVNKYERKIANEALLSLQCILKNIGCLLKPAVFKQLDDLVLKMIINMSQGIKVEPYNDVACKIELVRVLSALIAHHHWNGTVTAPLQYALQLLTKFQQNAENDNFQFANECATILSVLNRTIHPVCGTLQFPLLEEHNNTPNEDKNSLTNDTVLIESDSNEEIICTSNTVIEIVDNIPAINDNTKNVILLETVQNYNCTVIDNDNTEDAIMSEAVQDNSCTLTNNDNTLTDAEETVVRKPISSVTNLMHNDKGCKESEDADDDMDMCNAFVDVVYG